MINELQRQTYLSALGVDTYMPRWHLPFAPVSVACLLPAAVVSDEAPAAIHFSPISSDIIAPQAPSLSAEGGATPINSLISDFFETKKVSKIESPSRQAVAPLVAAAPLQTIAAFSLSVWRPIEGLMIVDSRNTQLALPTDALLKNIFRHLHPQLAANFKEEVLRCPMIENSFAKRTADDARAELQTWLSVQCEIRPFQYLWLMGENAVKYLLADAGDMQDKYWQSSAIADSSVQALLLPSLNELLMNPLLKKSLFSALRQYHS